MSLPSRAALLACVVIGGTAVPTHAQAVAPGGAASDSVTERYRAALLTLRDSVSRLQSDIDRFRRDLQGAGARTVENRARRLQASCQALEAALTVSEPGVRVTDSEIGVDQLRAAGRDLMQQMRSVRGALGEWCRGGLAPTGPGEWPDSLKAWAPYRTSRLERSLVALRGAATRFASAAGIKIEPRLPSN